MNVLTNIDIVMVFLNGLAGKNINGLDLTNNKQVNIILLDLSAIQENPLSIFPKMHTYKIMHLHSGISILAKSPINLNPIKHGPYGLGFENNPQLMKVSRVEFQMVHLRLWFIWEEEFGLGVEEQVLEVTPVGLDGEAIAGHGGAVRQDY